MARPTSDQAGADPLHRLARHFGIEPAFQDAFGKTREVPRDSLRALVAAMGLEPFGEAEVADRLAEIEDRRAHRLVDPVVVRGQHEPLRIPLTLPAPDDRGSIHFRLRLADGTLEQGRSRVDRLGVMPDSPSKRALELRHRPPVGEHWLEVWQGDAEVASEVALIVAPERCFGMDDMGRDRLWGLGAQLYGLRRSDGFGIGDFSDLGRLAEIGGGHGASFIGVSPLHALFAAEPRHISPYSPSDRSFLNPLYIDPRAVPEFARSEEAVRLLDEPDWQGRLHAAQNAELVDYPAVAALKSPLFEALFRTFRAEHLQAGHETARGGAFQAFVQKGGAALFAQACFDALHEIMLHEHGIWSWRDWPEGFRHPDAAGVQTFATDHAERIAYFQYLQWIADEQLDRVQTRARAAGMPIGLYRDLAVGVAPDGSMAWRNAGVTVTGAAVGAPPDLFNTKGQNWGLAPYSPVGLQNARYRPMIDDLRQNMRHAGAVRIDHVMGLARLFWIPDGASPAEGAYVRYPLQDLLKLIALQSVRERCLVVGEDLGTVPEGFRETMGEAGILSYRLLWFERTQGGGILPPRDYPERALISASTHDLPTIRGFFAGHDLDWRERLDMQASAEDAADARATRASDRKLLIEALRRAGLLEADLDPGSADFHEHLEVAVHGWLASTPSQLMMVQLEDLVHELEQANLPGTIDQHPNWRRRLPLTIEELAEAPALARLEAIMTTAGRSARG